jgi:hypothetical protein
MEPDKDAASIYYPFLNRLRESGATNMFGAAPYLVQQFDLEERDAKNVLLAWMKWVNENPKNRDK